LQPGQHPPDGHDGAGADDLVELENVEKSFSVFSEPHLGHFGSFCVIFSTRSSNFKLHLLHLYS
jgi:hypothetical protein